MKFTLQPGTPYRSGGVMGMAFNTHREYPDMSAQLLEVSGWHGLEKSLNSTRCFYVLEGEGTFVVAGRDFPVSAGEVVFVSWNTPHDFTGSMKLFVVHSPAWRKELVVRLE